MRVSRRDARLRLQLYLLYTLRRGVGAVPGKAVRRRARTKSLLRSLANYEMHEQIALWFGPQSQLIQRLGDSVIWSHALRMRLRIPTLPGYPRTRAYASIVVELVNSHV